MTPGQVELVRKTWSALKPNAEQVAELFYARLFELDPTLRPLFKADMRAQGRMLTTVINMAISQLDRLDELRPVLRELGGRHATYGVRDVHYAIVASALLDTLATGLGPAFTPEIKDAWTEVYRVLASTMQDGAARSAALAA